MLDERMTTSRIYISKTKTLALNFNGKLICDCTMSMEHLGRVSDPLFWDSDKLTHVEVDDMCRAAFCKSKSVNITSRVAQLQCYVLS